MIYFFLVLLLCFSFIVYVYPKNVIHFSTLIISASICLYRINIAADATAFCVLTLFVYNFYGQKTKTLIHLTECNDGDKCENKTETIFTVTILKFKSFFFVFFSPFLVVCLHFNPILYFEQIHNINSPNLVWDRTAYYRI